MTLDTYLRQLPGRCQVCTYHVATQGHGEDCAPVAPADARDAALASITASDEDRDRIDAAIRRAASTRQPFSANSIRSELAGVNPPLIGARFRAAATAGVIRRIGYVTSTDPGTHAHPVAEWVAA